MDATRSRRTRDLARCRWYASHRAGRFARLLGFRPRPAPPAWREEARRPRADRSAPTHPPDRRPPPPWDGPDSNPS
jgi:hypothetical protein